MTLPVLKYGAPALRQKGARVDEVTAEIRQLVSDMFETMYEAEGIGLAAQQVGKALQVAVLDLRQVSDRPSSLWVDEEPKEVDGLMPLVLINPELRPLGESVSGVEGCLSFPEIYGEVPRPDTVEVRAITQEGETLAFRCAGLLARAIQHETDHLNGILFIDRMTPASKREIQPQLDELYSATQTAGKKRQRNAALR